MSTRLALVMRDVTKTYGPRVAVDGLSVAVPWGGIYCILGLNGSGKTSTLNLAAGLLEEDSGLVEFDSAKTGTACISYLQERSELHNPWLRVSEYLSLFHPRGRTGESGVGSALEAVGLEHESRTYLSHLSSGMRRRVDVARLVIEDRPIVLLDEPTKEMDAEWRIRAWELFARWKAKGKAVVIATHDFLELLDVGDDFLILQAGRAVAQGRVNQLRLTVEDDGRMPDFRRLASQLGIRRSASEPAKHE